MSERFFEFDYIVVGAGSAGCTVAARLAEDPDARVLLLEAGGSDRTAFCTVPGMISIVHTVPPVKKRFDWGYYTVPQRHAANRRIPTVRGKVLGGSSSINGMLFVRGHRSNYDGWAADGCPGWAFDDVLPAFKRLEDWEGGASAFRGAGGPVAVTRQKAITRASETLVQAFATVCGVPIIEDYNAAEQTGASVFQMSARGGRRFSASEAYIEARTTTNLATRTGMTVSRVVFDLPRAGGSAPARAVGVEAILENGERRVLRAEREVILAGGVIGSAHLLLLSGVGPAGHLSEHGIDVVADLPVGENLHDHLFVPMTFLAPTAVHRGTALHFFGGMLAEATRGDTWFGRTVFEACAFVRSSFATGPARVPDLQIHSLPWSYPSPNQDAPIRPKVDGRPALTVLPTLIYPKSRGTLRLASADPATPPLIDPHYLEEPDDARFLVAGMKLVREIMAHASLRDVVTAELHPGRDVAGDEGLARDLPMRIHTTYHPVGTCRMGSDERAVVDPELRVRGVEGLRVADASVIPSIPGGNTNAPSMMIGERCAELVRRGSKAPSRA